MTRPRHVTVAVGSAEAEHRVRASRFLAMACPVATLDEAAEAREHERRRYHNAAHHVYAARIADGQTRFDDDGEPAGTGGSPVLRAIDAADLRDVVVVVTRYFGGIKLGTGGLGRAYETAAARALAATPGRRMVHGRRVRVSFTYDDTGAVSHLIDRLGAVRLREEYGENAALVVGIPTAAVERFTRELVDATSGRAAVEALNETMLLPLDT